MQSITPHTRCDDAAAHDSPPCSADDCLPPRNTSPHQDSTEHSPQRHTDAGTAAPTPADTGNTIPQRANLTQNQNETEKDVLSERT